MLDKIAVFTKGGIVLWSESFTTLVGNPIDDLIQTVLLEERKGAEKSFIAGSYKIEWTFHNDLELVFVAVYQKILQLLYIEEMLELVKKKFCSLFGDAVRAKTINLSGPLAFDKPFERIRLQCEAKAQEAKQARGAQRRFEDTKRGKEVVESTKAKGEKKEKASKKSKGDEGEADNKMVEEEVEQQDDEGTGAEDASATGESASAAADPEATILANRAALLKKKAMGRGRGAPGPMRKGPKSKIPAAAPPAAADTKKKGKVARKWEEDGPGKIDYSEKSGQQEFEASDKYGDASEPINADDWDSFFKNKRSPVDEEDDDDEGTQTKSGSSWSIGSIFSGLTNRVLKREELMPVLGKFRETLIAKNVASEIADELVESVCTSLEGKTMSSFSRVRSAVRTTLEEALTRILTPKSRLEILQEVARVKKEGRPYVIAFVGVNGVGKSTNLSKVCNYLLQNKLNVMITACDTFRSGAVEQLRVHSRNLNVPLFERGYEKDPALVAQHGIYEAKQKGMDVVLIDTAGRMQDNRRLMQALAKLVYTNNPDLILFVGEALVGNEAVDQLRGFNLALSDFVPSNVAQPRQIDGIILTKFDTIDDKVGAAISMVYTTGQPIVFVGTGQKYGDIKRMNVSTVIRALLD